MHDSFARVLLDSNVYGFMAEMDKPREFVLKVGQSGVLVCGSRVVRNELRAISLNKTFGSKKLRALTLELYGVLVDFKRNYSVTSFVEELAVEYMKEYNGSFGWKKLKNDFLIVATASIHRVPIVCTSDSTTMASKNCISAYKAVNKKFELPELKFISFNEFRQMVK